MTAITDSGSVSGYVFIAVTRDGSVYVVTNKPTDIRYIVAVQTMGLPERAVKTDALPAGSICREVIRFGHARRYRQRNAGDVVGALDRRRRAFGSDAGSMTYFSSSTTRAMWSDRLRAFDTRTLTNLRSRGSALARID